MVFEEKQARKLLRMKGIIYFLLSKGEVVYVGKSVHNINRPFEHKDKTFDEVYFYRLTDEFPMDQEVFSDFCKENTIEEKDLLDIYEDYFIMKYKPKYNKTMNYKLYKPLKKVCRDLTYDLNIRFNKRKLYGFIKDLNLKTIPDIFTSDTLLSITQVDKIYDYYCGLELENIN